MTKQEAKELSLEVWRYLAEHPEIRRKENLPDGIYNKIRDLEFECPLCEVLRYCALCPLADCAPYERWVDKRDTKVRQGAAREIVRLIEAWEPEETK
jgi:hypothetical protein